MRDAFIRTLVPFIVGYLIAWGAKAGLDLPEAALTELLTVVFGAAYYALAHWLEKNVNTRLGQVMLSAGLSRKSPTYRGTPRPGA